MLNDTELAQLSELATRASREQLARVHEQAKVRVQTRSDSQRIAALLADPKNRTTTIGFCRLRLDRSIPQDRTFAAFKWLEQSGLVVKRVGENDTRTYFWELTESGQDFANKGHQLNG